MSLPRTIASVSQAIDLGLQYHQAGYFAQAQELYLTALRADPNHPDALHLLGMVAHQTGRHDLAVDLIGKATRIVSSNPIFFNNLGEAYRASGNLSKAIAAYRKSLSLKPDLAEVHNNLGLTLREQGKLADAEASCKRAIALCPGYAEAHYNLGLVLQDLHRLDEAAAAYRQVLSLVPDHAEAHNNLGLALQELGLLDEALAAYAQAISLAPGYAEAHNNLGNAYREQGKTDDAVAAYRRALALRPELAETHRNLGSILAERGLLDEAVVAYKEALSFNPENPETHNALGVALQQQGNQEEAAFHYQKALSLKPDFAEACNNLGNVFANHGKLDQAISCYRKALSLAPDFADAHLNLGNVFKDRAKLDEALACYRKALSLQPDNTWAYSNLLLTLQYVLPLTAEAVFAEAVEYGRRFEEPLKKKWQRPAHIRQPGDRLRVGFVSGDLRTHPVGFFLESILRHIDRASFALYAYANQVGGDALTQRITPFFDQWVSAKSLTDDELASRIRADEIDVLVDLSGHTSASRLLVFARKPAPVQVSWVGYPNTTGLQGMDYILADPISLPGMEESFYTEKAWRLPETYLCFTPPDAKVEVAPLPVLENGYVTFGCFNNPAKLNDHVIACWAEILRQLPDSVLLLKNMPFGDEAVCQDYRGRFAAWGVDPARLRFEGWSSRSEYLAAYQRVDLALDPFPFPGATTTCDALWMGVPTLTRVMPRGLVGHNGELILRNVGLPNWVAESDEEYIAKARVLAADIESLAFLRASLRQRFLSSPLCDAERFARHLESAFRGMVQSASPA